MRKTGPKRSGAEVPLSEDRSEDTENGSVKVASQAITATAKIHLEVKFHFIIIISSDCF